MPILLIHATGRDKPGIVEQLTQSLRPHPVRLLDVGQAVIHRLLTIGILVEFGAESRQTDVLKDLLFAGHRLGLDVRFSPVEPAEYEGWVERQGESRHIVTLFGPRLLAEHLSRISQIITHHGLNISVITRLSGRPSLVASNAEDNACIELSVRGTPPDASLLRRDILVAAQDLNCDIAIQVDDMYRRNRRMIAFDMDSTLIQTEVINELARVHGVEDQVFGITERAMNGELDFNQSLRQRLSLLKGLSSHVMEEIAQNLPLTRGATRLIKTVQGLGYKTAILSGGFTYFGNHLKQLLGIDYVFANELEIKEGHLTGNVVGTVVDAERKAQLLKETANQEGIKLQQVIAVGDGANDLPMLDAAGLGIAFHAKPKVKESAEQHISTAGLDGILYLIGVRDREIPEHL